MTESLIVKYIIHMCVISHNIFGGKNEEYSKKY